MDIKEWTIKVIMQSKLYVLKDVEVVFELWYQLLSVKWNF